MPPKKQIRFKLHRHALCQCQDPECPDCQEQRELVNKGMLEYVEDQPSSETIEEWVEDMYGKAL